MVHRMKRALGLVAFGLVLALAATLLIVPRVAAASCFPDVGGHWAETFICWIQSHGIVSGYPDGTYRPDNNVTRGEMAVFVRNVADVPPTTGLILISVSPGDWVPSQSNDSLDLYYFAEGLRVARNPTGLNYLSVHPDVPTVLYGKSVQLTGVEFCYRTDIGTTLSSVSINILTDSFGPPGIVNSRFYDDTDRNDTTCRLYSLGTPYVLTSDDAVNFYIGVEWTIAFNQFVIGRTTFVFEATDIDAAAP